MVLNNIKKSILVVLAWLSLLAGLVGIFLPIIPTTPFILLSAYLLSKSSSKYHKWLIEHKKLGPLIVDWQRDGVIRTKSKILALGLMIVMFIISIVSIKASVLFKFGLGVICFLVSLFIATRPSCANSK